MVNRSVEGARDDSRSSGANPDGLLLGHGLGCAFLIWYKPPPKQWYNKRKDRKAWKMKKGNTRLKDVLDDIKDWIEWNISPTVALSITALLISIASATLSIGRLIQYLITH